MDELGKSLTYLPVVLKGALLLGSLVYLAFAIMIWRHVVILEEVLKTPKTIWFRRLALGHLLAGLLLIFLILALV